MPAPFGPVSSGSTVAACKTTLAEALETVAQRDLREEVLGAPGLEPGTR